jgi:hypothetical protein
MHKGSMRGARIFAILFLLTMILVIPPTNSKAYDYCDAAMDAWTALDANADVACEQNGNLSSACISSRKAARSAWQQVMLLCF